MKLNALLAAGLFAGVASTATAGQSVYTATLDGSSESSPNSSTGTGTAIVTIDSDQLTMRVQESFSNLAAGVTASHIHCCTSAPDTGTAGVATTTPTFTDFPSGVMSGTYDHTFDMTQASSYNSAFITANDSVNGAFQALVAGLNAGTAYANIHSTAFPMGEIRGFLHAAPIPEPETYAMLLAGLGLIGAIARRRNRA
ncbi:MAG: CHRD domain-containing protein [Nitrosospira sp.]|nr:CHRD domain-containing protein [Nitrosospira sp.]